MSCHQLSGTLGMVDSLPALSGMWLVSSHKDGGMPWVLRGWCDKRAHTDPSVSSEGQIRQLLGTTQVISASSFWRLLVLRGFQEAASSVWPVTCLIRIQTNTLCPMPMPDYSCSLPWSCPLDTRYEMPWTWAPARYTQVRIVEQLIPFGENLWNMGSRGPVLLSCSTDSLDKCYFLWTPRRCPITLTNHGSLWPSSDHLSEVASYWLSSSLTHSPFSWLLVPWGCTSWLVSSLSHFLLGSTG